MISLKAEPLHQAQGAQIVYGREGDDLGQVHLGEAVIECTLCGGVGDTLAPEGFVESPSDFNTGCEGGFEINGFESDRSSEILTYLDGPEAEATGLEHGAYFIENLSTFRIRALFQEKLHDLWISQKLQESWPIAFLERTVFAAYALRRGKLGC